MVAVRAHILSSQLEAEYRESKSREKIKLVRKRGCAALETYFYRYKCSHVTCRQRLIDHKGVSLLNSRTFQRFSRCYRTILLLVVLLEATVFRFFHTRDLPLNLIKNRRYGQRPEEAISHLPIKCQPFGYHIRAPGWRIPKMKYALGHPIDSIVARIIRRVHIVRHIQLSILIGVENREIGACGGGYALILTAGEGVKGAIGCRPNHGRATRVLLDVCGEHYKLLLV